MPIIKAVSISPAARSWISGSAQPRVLNLFENACNLVNEHNEVLSVVAEQIGDGPFNLVVSELPELSWVSTILLEPGQITVGDLTIDLQAAQVWEPRPDWDHLRPARERLVELARSLSIEPAHLPPPLRNELSAAVAAASMEAGQRAAAQLAGLGPGLTPAGDDFLMGAIHAAWIIHNAETAQQIGEAVTAEAVPRTTTLSGAWLRAAARGEAAGAWHTLFNAVLAADTAATENAVGTILEVGETSGADALAGFAGTLRAFETDGSSNP